MILPFVLLVADIAAWWLASQIAAQGDTALTLIAGLLGVGFLIWLAIEVYDLSESATNRRGRAGRPDGE